MIGAQSWDLEGFFLNGSELTMVGGYNFFQGNDNFLSGDIFIDVDGILNPANNSGNSSVNTAFGYDYVIDLDFTPNNYRYRVIELTGSVYTQPVYYSQNVLGNPWAYVSGGTEVSGWQSLNYATGLTNAQTEFLGGNHYALDVDLGFLSGINHKIGLHYTMQCGNDNLMGEYTPVPEPGTFALLGVGLLGLIAIRRKK
ncbi:PEP-CTERM sorting domain-containing protein [candidate division KSB1 bacterium]|nr:PEP-CTERM sorting domain-containing protein [candidate division KSB1 bacterium]